MSNKPQVSIAFSNGNLLANLIAPDGYCGLIGIAYNDANTANVFIINSLAEAEAQGINAIDEPVTHRHIKEFYQELAGNMRLYVQLFSLGTLMADMLDFTNPASANKLVKTAAGELSLIGVFKADAPGYTGGSGFVDSDSVNALTAAKGFAQYWNGKGSFFRLAIEARVNNEDAITDIYSPQIADNGYAALMIGGSLNDNSASIGLLAGRKAKYAAHIKLGKVANGALSITNAYIGTRQLAEDGGDVISAVPEVKAAGTMTITGAGAENDYVSLYVRTANGWVFLSNYQRQLADNTPTLVATAIQAAINANTGSSGYTATRAAAVITVTAPAGLGASANGFSLFLAKDSTVTITATTTAFAGGADAIPEQIFNSDIFHDKGYITFLTYPNKAGYFFGIDQMASTDDYRILVNGCVIDAAAKVAQSVYTGELEAEVDTNADGTITEIDAKHLEDRIVQQVNLTLGDRISGFSALVDRTVNLINSSRLPVKLRVRPKGYLTYIDVDLGLTAGE